MTASLKKVYIFISEGEGIAKTKTSNIYVASWVQGVSKGTTNKGSTISKISYSKKAVNVHGCVWGCELSCETSLNQFTVVLDVYSANTLARDNFLGRQYLHFDLLTPGKFKKVYPSRPPHDPTAQTCLAYYTQYGYKTALALVDKCDSAVFKEYLYMDHVQAMSRYCESKGSAERSKKHTVQGTLTISCLVVDNRKAAIQNKKSGSGSSLKERPLPLPPLGTDAPPCPSYRAPPPPPPQDEPGSVKDIAVAVKSPLHRQQALEQDTTYEPYDPSQEGDCYEPYDPSQIDEGGDSVYSLVGQCVNEIDLDGGQAADAKGLHEVSYDPVAAGSGEDGREYEYVRLSRHSSAAMQAYISPGVGDHSGDNEEPESSHEGTPGVEQRLEEGVERRLEEGVERRLEEGLEQGLEERLEQGLEERLEQGLEEGLEQGLEEGLEQGLEEGLEQGLEEGLESPLGASPSLQQDTPTSPFGSPIPDCAEDDVYDDVVITRHGNGIVHYGDEPTITNRDEFITEEDVYDDVVVAPDPDQSSPTPYQAPPTPYQAPPTPYQAPPISQSSEAPPTTALSVLPALVHQMEANAAPSQTTPIMQAPPQTTPIMQAPPSTTPIMQAPPAVLPAAAPLRQSHYQATPITPPTSCPKDPEQSCTVRPRPRPPSRSSFNPFLPPAPSSPTAHSHTPHLATPICQSSDPATAYNQAPPTPQPQAANSDLPPGWEAARTSDGRVYYVHRQSKVASWDRPFVAPDGPVPPPPSIPAPPPSIPAPLPPSIPAPPPPSTEARDRQETGLKSLGALQGMTNRPTVPPPQGMTTVPPPQGMTTRPTVPPPQGMTNRPTVPPPQGMTTRPTVPPPQGMTTVPPPQGMTTVPPPQGMTNRPTVPPPQGMTTRPTVPPPQGMTTVPPPQGMTTVPPPQGMTTVSPPQGMTTVPPPQGMTNRPTAPPFQGDDTQVCCSHRRKATPVDPLTQSPIDWDPRIDLDWDIYNANDDDDVMMGQATPNFNNQPTLPPGWERKITPEGRVYYLDHNTKRTQWEDPRLQSPSTVNLSPAPVNPLVAAPSSLNPSVVTRPPVNPLMAAPSPANPLMAASSPVNPLMAASSLVNPLMAASPSPSILGPLPPGWEMVRMSDGRMYYVNNHMHLSQWEDPRLQARNPFGASLPMQGTGPYMGLGTGPYIGLGPLPVGWEVRRTPEGHTYYVDNRTNRTQWEDPRLQTPLLQSYKQKLVYFRSTLPVASNGVLAITAHRGSLLEDSYSAIMNVKDILQLRSKPKVQFYGDPEVVSSNDGQLREWLQLLSQVILNPSCGLFQHLTSQRPQLLINPDSGLYNPGHLGYFRFYGRVCGLAIYNNMVIDAFFIRPFYKMMLGKKVTFEDMQSVDFKLYNTLGFIMSNVLRTAHLRFSVKNTVFEELQDDLKPNGRNISVTEENKREYVDLMVTWRLVSRVKDQMDAFMKGFSDVIPPNLIQVFDERELEYLMGGLAEIDVEDWKKNTEYIGYTANDDVIVWFWKAVSSYDNEMRTRLLQFVTGMSSVPRRGFAMLQGLEGLRKFTISKAEDDQALPRAAVSFNILHLPPYGDQMQLVKMLSAALLEPKTLK